MKPNSKKKERKPRLDFAQRLAQKLIESGLGEVDEGALSDDSGRWVNLKIGRHELCFSFDMKGEKIDGVGLHKDIVRVVDQVKVWPLPKKTKPEPKPEKEYVWAKCGY